MSHESPAWNDAPRETTASDGWAAGVPEAPHAYTHQAPYADPPPPAAGVYGDDATTGGAVGATQGDCQLDLSDIALEWIANEDRIGYQQFTAIEIPDFESRFSLYHRVLHAFFIPYRTRFFDGRDMTQDEQVNSLASNLCDALDNTIDGRPSSETYYNTLLGGRLPTLRISMSQYTPDGMRKKLTSQTVGCDETRPDEVVIEYLSSVLKIGILVLDAHRRDIAPMECYRKMKEYDSTIVLLFHRQDPVSRNPPYFNCVALVPNIIDEDLRDEILENATTLFSTSHSFIQSLHTRAETVAAKYNALMLRH